MVGEKSQPLSKRVTSQSLISAGALAGIIIVCTVFTVSVSLTNLYDESSVINQRHLASLQNPIKFGR